VSKKLERTELQTPPEPLLLPDSSAPELKPRTKLVVIPRKLRSRGKAKKSRHTTMAVEQALQAMAYLLEWSSNRFLIHGIAMALGDCVRQVHGLRAKNRP
jgi:hypothetical protein